MIAIIDYKCGNLFSLSRSLSFIETEAVVTGARSSYANATR
jgi:imidazoleglycerol phosphate synthase glutamine amidotransferase subunit HisH